MQAILRCLNCGMIVQIKVLVYAQEEGRESLTSDVKELGDVAVHSARCHHDVHFQ